MGYFYHIKLYDNKGKRRRKVTEIEGERARKKKRSKEESKGIEK